VQREDFREEFQKKRFDEAEEIANRTMGAKKIEATHFHQLSPWIYLYLPA